MIILGDSGVEKTKLILRFVGEMYKTDHIVKVGIDFKIKTLQIEDKLIKLNAIIKVLLALLWPTQ